MSSAGSSSAGEQVACARGYHHCRTGVPEREFYLADLTPGADPASAVQSFSSEEGVRDAAKSRYPGARYALVRVPHRTLEHVVVIAVCSPPPGASSDGAWPVVAYVTGESRTPTCIPFTPSVWPDVTSRLVCGPDEVPMEDLARRGG